VVCNDHNQCTSDACDTATGSCTHTDRADGTSCDFDGAPGVCVDGLCESSDGGPCSTRDFDANGVPDVCPPGSNYIEGTAGADTLNGTTGSDCIFGRGGNDYIAGSNGDDYICAGDGADDVLAEGDNDTIFGEGGADTVNGGNGDDFIDGGNDNDVLDGGGGDDWMSGGPGIDTLDGEAGTNTCVAEVPGTSDRLTNCQLVIGGACPAGADTFQAVDLMVDTGGFVLSYEVAAAGLLVTPGPTSGNLLGDASVGMGTDALGNARSIQDGAPNESMVFEIFRSDGLSRGAPEGAINMTITVLGLPTSNEILLSAEDKVGKALGSATTTIAVQTIDVSALIPGEIHRLTVEATSGATILRGIGYTHVCLGYTP
jgi:hypothetical protein